MIQYTLLLDPGSTTRGALHYESPVTGYVSNLGPAQITADGWCFRNGYWLQPEQFKSQSQPTLTDRVIADVLALIPEAMARAKQLSEREPVAAAPSRAKAG